MSDDRNYYAIIPANVRYDKDLPPNAKLLYAEITALSNQDGYCWATNKYFAELYKTTVRSIILWLDILEEKGYIFREMIYEENSKNITQRKIFITSTLVNKISWGSEKNFTGGSEKNFTHNIKDINNINNNIIKEKIYKKEKIQNETLFVKSSDEDVDDISINPIEEYFENFWKSYPRHNSKKKAKEKFMKICKDEKTYQKIMNALEFQKQKIFSKDLTFIPHAVTWLNQERYNDEFEEVNKQLTPLDQEYYDNDLDF